MTCSEGNPICLDQKRQASFYPGSPAGLIYNSQLHQEGKPTSEPLTNLLFGWSLYYESLALSGELNPSSATRALNYAMTLLELAIAMEKPSVNNIPDY